MALALMGVAVDFKHELIVDTCPEEEPLNTFSLLVDILYFFFLKIVDEFKNESIGWRMEIRLYHLCNPIQSSVRGLIRLKAPENFYNQKRSPSCRFWPEKFLF